MSNDISTQQIFLDELIGITIKEEPFKELLTGEKKWKHLFLDFASETEENIRCLNYVEYGQAVDQNTHKTIQGFKVKGKNIFLSDIMNVVENLDIPDLIRESFPDLTQDEWDSVTRMITVLLTLIEKPVR